MPIPGQGFLAIYPSTVSIVSGNFSVSGNGVGSASPLATVNQLQTYYDTRLDTPANAPRTQYVTQVPPASARYVPAPGVYELQFSPDSTRILFDPFGTPVEIDFLSADFPMGLTVNQLSIWWNGSYGSGPDRDRLISNLSLKYFGTTYKSITPTPNTTFDGDISSNSSDIVPSYIDWSIGKAMKQFGFSATVGSTVSVGLNIPFVRNDLFFLLMIYNTQYMSLNLNTPMAGPGDIVDITDDNGHLDRFDDFYIYWDGEPEIDPELPGLTGGIIIPWYLIRTAFRIRFIIPPNKGIPYGGKRLVVVGKATGTFFVGSIPIANLNILLTDGSGVYHLEAGKRVDTYYDRSTTPVETVDIKIPAQYIRTGYF